MSSLDWPQELAFVRELALDAGRHIRKAASNPQVERKGPVNLVTQVDVEVERRVVEALSQRYPDHEIVAEEGSEDARPSDRPVWYIDPLDGTTNFVHGHPFYTVSLACWDGNQPRLACVYAPAMDELFSATDGNGARYERPLTGDAPCELDVSGRQLLSDSLLATGFPYVRTEPARITLRCCAEALARARGLRRGGSASLDLCYVAAGRLDGFWELTLRPWDVAAGALIAREAGAVVTDFEGGSDYLWGRRIVASTPRIHDEMLRMIADAHQTPEQWPLGDPFDGPVSLRKSFETGER